MLKVQFKEKPKKEYLYMNLAVGEVFVDDYDNVCIKIQPNTCLVFTGEKWEIASISEYDGVRPIKATLMVEE
jgi:hypothetical protein